MVVRRKRFNQDYPFEVLLQECVGRGKGGFKWTRPRVSGLTHLKVALIYKLRRILKSLEADVYGLETTEQFALRTSASSFNLPRTEQLNSLSIPTGVPVSPVKLFTKQSWVVPCQVKVVESLSNLKSNEPGNARSDDLGGYTGGSQGGVKRKAQGLDYEGVVAQGSYVALSLATSTKLKGGVEPGGT